MTLLSPFPIQKSDITFGAEYDYRLIDALLAEGVIGSGDFAVSQKAAGANMSVDVAAGTAVVEVNSPYGGKRLVRNGATMNSGTPGSPGSGWATTFAAADGSLPRIDRVVLEVKDSNVDSSGLYEARLKVVGGTATSGATLTNLTGAAAVPDNCLLLANVLIDAAATTITTAKIDTATPLPRPRARPGSGALGGVQIAASVSELVAVDGALAQLRVGSTPYEFLAVVYDATAGKWVSEPRWVSATPDSGYFTNNSTSYVAVGCFQEVKNYKAIHDAGMRLQVAYSGWMFTDNVSHEARIGVNVYDFDNSDTTWATLTTGYDAQSTTSVTAVIRARDSWAQPAVTPTQTHGMLTIGLANQTLTHVTSAFWLTLGHRFVSA